MRRFTPLLLLAALLIPSSADAAVRALPTPAARGSGEPSLTRGPDGRVWLSWFEKRPSGGHALKLAALSGRRWSAPRTIATGDSFFVNWADFPGVLAVGADRLVAHWPWRRPGGTYAYDVRVAWSEDGGRTWSDPIVPHRDDTATEHGFGSLAADGDGARLVWLDGRNMTAEGSDGHGHGGGAMTLRTARLLPGGGLEDQAELDARTCDCCQTAIVSTPSGFVVAYRDRGDDERRDVSIVRSAGGGWSTPVDLHRDGWKVEGCPVNGPSLDAGGDDVVAAWYTAAADSPRVRVAFSGDGGASFGAPLRVDAGAPLGRVDVVRLPDGAALVLWLEGGSGDAATILARRVGRDGRIGESVTIARTRAARGSGFPRAVLDGERLVLAWTDAAAGGRVKVASLPLPR